jgi:DNA polymerase-3 subunit delta
MDAAPTHEKPIVYIFHGDDSFAIQRHIETMLRQLGEPSLAALNVTRLDGRQASQDALYETANAMPFLAERRIVIFTYPFARIQSDAARKRFLAFLNGLPPSTALLLVVEDQLEGRGRNKDWRSLPNKPTHWIRRWLDDAGRRAFYQLCQLPSPHEMPEWIRKEARRAGGQFSAEAAAALVAHLGNDTRLAGQEITKLLIYVDNRRPVEAEDVEELTAQVGEADVFAMVDSLSAGDARQALGLLHRLLETQDPLSIFGMVVRQFRLLIQTRELLDEGRSAHAAQELRLHPFVAEKMTGQAGRFSIAQLEAIYQRLLLVDEGIKSGQMLADLALDSFVASLAR